MVKKIFGFMALVLIMTAALVAYSVTSEPPKISNVTGAVDSYKHQIFAKVKDVAAPVLKKAGIDIEQVPQTEDLNVVENQMQEATEKVNEATQALTNKSR